MHRHSVARIKKMLSAMDFQEQNVSSNEVDAHSDLRVGGRDFI